jgi:hypothetical protein
VVTQVAGSISGNEHKLRLKLVCKKMVTRWALAEVAVIRPRRRCTKRKENLTGFPVRLQSSWVSNYFLPDFCLADLAFMASEILFRAEADMVR